VADVVDSVEDTHQAAWTYGRDSQTRSIQLSVMRQPGANVIDVAEAVKAALPSLQAQIPPSAHINVRFDRSRNIREAFSDIQFTMLLTLALVIGVILVFLRNVPATVIPAMALPIALLGTCAVMAIFHYSLDNLSMMALILSVGFVVDDAIVMVENIMRHIENGVEPMQAALDGSREIGFTILSMTISLTAVFIPILFMGGILGRLFREFAVTITVAILVSGLVSISLTPMLCSRILRGAHKEGRLARAMDWPFQKMLAVYSWSLKGVLRYRGAMAFTFLAVLGLTAYLFQIVPKGFIPDSDQDTLQLNLRAAQGTSFDKMVEYQKRIADVVRKDPNVEAFLANVNGGNFSNMNITLKPRKQRELSAQEVVDELRPKLANFPGFQVFMNMPPALRIGGRQSNSSYQFTLQGVDTDQLYKVADTVEAAIAKIPEVSDVSSDLQIKNPMERVSIDRERSALYGLNPLEIESALYSAYGPQIVNTIYMPRGQYHVLEEIKPVYQQFVDYISKIYFKSDNGQLVPLDSLATVKPDVGPQSIAHSGQLPSVTVSFNLKTGVSLGTAVDKVADTAQRLLPAGVTASFSGNAQAFQSSLQNLSLLLLVAIATVYIVLGVLYESYIHPLTILSGLPSAGVGALVTLIVFHAELNIYSFVGLIMLVGLVKKNAIMQIDFALEAERNHGKSPIEAIYEGCLIRFRPIMMTTMAALLGGIPMALGYGAGGEARRPLGLAIVGGLLISQVMTLYLTPVVYTYMAAVQTWWSRKPTPVQSAAVPAISA
jgi:HAE1 family hydrophobic/amphiphilic exporter-1